MISALEIHQLYQEYLSLLYIIRMDREPAAQKMFSCEVIQKLPQDTKKEFLEASKRLLIQRAKQRQQEIEFKLKVFGVPLMPEKEEDE